MDAPLTDAQWAWIEPLLPDRSPRRGGRWRDHRDQRALRAHLRRRGIRTIIPQPADQIAHRKRRGRHAGRPPGFDKTYYKQHNTVDNSATA
ncbi:hypothetical protein ACFW1M_34320 [Streptomyces inhibens]|uniref:hypothetical protein n=1 Tax=Streptomyces inhibens TaxID=2293571 RepID=UPI0036B6F12E